jgi:hypothetical protein
MTSKVDLYHDPGKNNLNEGLISADHQQIETRAGRLSDWADIHPRRYYSFLCSSDREERKELAPSGILPPSSQFGLAPGNLISELAPSKEQASLICFHCTPYFVTSEPVRRRLTRIRGPGVISISYLQRRLSKDWKKSAAYHGVRGQHGSFRG